MIEALFPDEVVTVVATPALEGEPLHPLEADSTGRMSAGRLREFSLGRACARRALARLGHANAPVVRGADRVPVWPEGVVGSLTHCEGFCAVAVAPRGAIVSLGLDAEPDAPLSAGVLRRVCSESEREQLARLPGRSPEAWGKLVFSAKESFYKCYFAVARARLGFHDAEIRLDPERGRFEARLLRADAPAAAGARSFHGRFALAPPLVLTGVTLRREGSRD